MGAASSCLRDGFGRALLESLNNQGNAQPGAQYASHGNAQPGTQYASHGHEEQVLFFPDHNQPCRDFFKGLLAHLSSAQRSLDIAVFTITNNMIRDALLERHRKGVRIRIITDDTQSESKGSDVQELARAGIKTVHDDSSYHMHHKFCIIDGRKLLNGSLNWTVQGVQNNQENVMVTTNLAFVKPFQAKFDNMWGQFSRNMV